MKSSKSNSMKKAVKAFLGVRRRDVSKWPEQDVPRDYKQRLSNGKRNFGVETRGLKETRGGGGVRDRRSSSQPPPSQRSSDSAYGDELVDDGVYEYVPDPPTMYRDGDNWEEVEVDHSKDPWDDHKASKEQQAIDMVATTSRQNNLNEERGTGEIDERLKSCISALDRLTTQLDTVVNLTEQIDQIREEVMPTGQHQAEDQFNDSYYNPQQSQENKASEEDYHSGRMTGEAPKEEVPDKLPGRLPSRTPSTRKHAMLVARPTAPPAKLVGPDKRYHVQQKLRYGKKGHQAQEDNWSSSGYSSGSFDSISPYQQQYEVYGSYYPQADPYHQQYVYDHFYQEEGYGMWQDPAQAVPLSGGEWYYGGVGEQMNPYGYYSENGSYQHYDPYDWSAVYRPYDSAEGSYYAVKPQDNDDAESRASLSVSVDSGKRKTVRFSKMVQERQSDDGKDTTSVMKGSPPDDRKRRSGRRNVSKSQRTEAETYEFPKGHIESSCMCGECILARKSICEKKQKEMGCYA